MYIFIYIHIHVYIYICIYPYIFTHTYTYTKLAVAKCVCVERQPDAAREEGSLYACCSFLSPLWFLRFVGVFKIYTFFHHPIDLSDFKALRRRVPIVYF